MSQLPKHDPLGRTATREEIKARLRELESSPVVVGGWPVDCDENSVARMRNTIEYWDNIVGVENGYVNWVFADNVSRALSKDDLESLLRELLIERATRSAILFYSARSMKNVGTVTVRELKDNSVWGLPLPN